MPAKGATALYRPVPADFRERFIELGWDEIEAHYRAHAKTIRKWMDVVGHDELVHDRAAFVEKRRAQRRAERRRLMSVERGRRMG